MISPFLFFWLSNIFAVNFYWGFSSLFRLFPVTTALFFFSRFSWVFLLLLFVWGVCEWVRKGSNLEREREARHKQKRKKCHQQRVRVLKSTGTIYSTDIFGVNRCKRLCAFFLEGNRDASPYLIGSYWPPPWLRKSFASCWSTARATFAFPRFSNQPRVNPFLLCSGRKAVCLNDSVDDGCREFQSVSKGNSLGAAERGGRFKRQKNKQ